MEKYIRMQAKNNKWHVNVYTDTNTPLTYYNLQLITYDL